MNLEDVLKKESVFEENDEKVPILETMDNFLFSLNENNEYNEETYGDEYVQSFHPSKLIDEKCLRRMALDFFGAPQMDGEYEIGPKLRRVFDNGHKVHSRLQRYFQLYSRTPKAIFKLLGRWECRGCSKIIEDKTIIDEPEKCPHCGYKEFKYKEWKISIPELRTAGKVDGILRFEQGGIHQIPDLLLEIKSASTFVYQKLREPKPEHIIQFNMYLKTLKLKEGVFIYEDKNNQNWKAFYLQYNAGRIKKVLKDLGIVNSLLNDRKLPPITKEKELCKKCTFRKSCRTYKIPKDWR
jgi:CRISPR/Cas system-associated exonuclease Cas4 (RecB family)